MMHGGLDRRRRRRHLLGRPDHGRGRPVACPASLARTSSWPARSSPATRGPRSALIPLLHLAQEQDGYVTDEAMVHIGELVGITPAEVLGTCSFYEMFKREPVGRYLVNVCTDISCMLLGGDELLEHAEETLDVKAGDTTADGLFTLEDVECIAACTEAPVPPGELPLLHQPRSRRAGRAARRPAGRPAQGGRARPRHPPPDPPAHPGRAGRRRPPDPTRAASRPGWSAARPAEGSA